MLLNVRIATDDTICERNLVKKLTASYVWMVLLVNIFDKYAKFKNVVLIFVKYPVYYVKGKCILYVYNIPNSPNLWIN